MIEPIVSDKELLPAAIAFIKFYNPPLTDKGYKAKPLRRVFIEKKGKKAKRPLGIPCMYDRAMQALYALALDPVSETMADTKSFGFRKGRCAQDACEYIFTALSRSFSPQWVLEGDIKGCFDHISHDWLIEHIPMDKSVLKQFLKAGFVFQRELFPTDEGTPQGGVISPILANIALDGMQEVLSNRFHTNRLSNVDIRFKNAHKVNLVRYANDFIVTAATKEIAEEAKEIIRDFLQTRGLELSEEKTVITHIDDAFDMLGWTFRKFKGTLIVKPSKKSLKAFKSALSETILGRGKAWKQEVLIEKLNQQIRGWTNYHQSVCASEAFAHINYILYELLWRWAKRRPHKGQWWASTNYWHRRGDRLLSAKEKSIIDRCTANVYRDYIREGYRGSVPTLQDFHAELLRQSEPEARDVALAIELFTEGSLNTFAKPTNVDTDARILCYDIRDLGKQLLPVGMLVVLDSVFNRVIRNRALGRNTWVYIDEIYLLFQHEYSANFLFTLWKRVRKYGACCTGLTQNVDDLLQSHTARTMLANSEFLVMLNQAATDRAELARLLNISDNQLSYITNVDFGRGLIKCGSAIVPFMDNFPKNRLYRLMTTKLSETNAG